jgi:hypothetical protein
MGPKQQQKSSSISCTEQDTVAGSLDDSILSIIKQTVLHSVSAFKDEIRDIMNTRFNSLEAAIADLKQQLTAKDEIITRVRDDNIRLRSELMTVNSRINDLETYNRIDNLIIKGIPESSYSEAATPDAQDHGESSDATMATVLNLCDNVLQVKISPEDVSVTHRLPKGPKDKYRPIIVRFVNRRARDRVYATRRSLRKSNKTDESSPIYINEHLTKHNGRLAALCRRLLKDRKIVSTWTYQGVVYLKVNDTSKPIRISSEDDLKL